MTYANLKVNIMTAQIKDLSKFKSISNNLFEMVSKEENLTSAKMLQMLSQSMFSKPYEEVKETIFEKEISKTYILFHNESAYLLTKNNLIFLDNELLDKDKLIKKANAVSKKIIKIDNVIFNSLPNVLASGEANDGKETTYKDAKFIAKLLGYFSKKTNLFNLVDDFSGFKINGSLFEYSISGDWFESVSNEGVDTCIWFIEFFDEDNNFYEHYFSLREICEAVSHDNKVWDIKEDDTVKTIELLY